MRRVGLAALLVVLAAVLWWVIGFLPWVVHGFGESFTTGGDLTTATDGLGGVRLPVPLLADQLGMLVSSGVLGGVLAGLAPLAYARHRWATVPLVWLAVAGVGAATCWFSIAIVREHAAGLFPADRRVLIIVLGVLVAATVLGLLLGSLSVIWAGATSLAAALLAAAIPVWLRGFHPTVEQLGPAAQVVADVLVAVVLVVGLVSSVRRTPWAALLWPLAFAVAWCAPAADHATEYVESQVDASPRVPSGTLLLQGAVRELGRQLELQAPHRWPLAIAFGAAAVWLVVRVAGRARRPREAAL